MTIKLQDENYTVTLYEVTFIECNDNEMTFTHKNGDHSTVSRNFEVVAIQK